MKALITGIEGFTGRYLAAELARAGYEVHGLAQNPPASEIQDIKTVHGCDLRNLSRLIEVVAAVQPDVVAHLAGISFVAHDDAEAIYATNLVGSRNLLVALSHLPTPPTAVLLASSSNIYGNATRGALKETSPLSPENDYAISKLAMEHVGRLFAERLPLITVRPFNYTGVGQSKTFLLPKIVDHYARRETTIELGNLDVARDFSDVRVVASIYARLLQTEAAIGEVYNVCSGLATSLGDVLLMMERISAHRLEVRVNRSFVRANDVKVLLGNRERLEGVLGHLENIPLETTLRWMWESAVPC